MSRTLRFATFAASLLALLASSCAEEAEVVDPGQQPGLDGQGKADSSAAAVFLDFELDGELLASWCGGSRSQIDNQLLYTIGQLNGDNSVGRLDKLVVSDVKTEQVSGGCRIGYHARLLVAWGKKNTVPETYTMTLPRNMSSAAVEKFTERYNPGCVDPHAHDVTSGIIWYYWRPNRSTCKLAEEDVIRTTATVSASPVATTGKYPEYHKVWEDGRLDVVAVFGKYEDGATSSYDSGISAYDEFNRKVKSALQGHGAKSTPAQVPYSPGIAMPDVTWEAPLPGGKTVRVTALLVDSVGAAEETFWSRYEKLTPTADFIVYNGHAGLGANIRLLAGKGEWETGQYAVVFMNGCDTYAYIDAALFEAHAAVNADDPDGTKFLDIVANAMPSFFRSMPAATMAIFNALLDYENPKTYEQIFGNIDESEVVLVTGEHDNVFYPGYTPGTETPAIEAWVGMTESGTVAQNEEKRYETPIVPAGRYEVVLSGTGDADLYVRVGEAPTADAWDCRPYEEGTLERCEVSLGAPAAIHVMVVGFAETSEYTLTGKALDQPVE